jgi:hypothetical protein
MSAYGTRRDLILACLDELKVTSYGSPPSAEEYDAVDTRLDGILGECSARGIVSVGNPDQIGVELMVPLAQVLARHLGSRFSVTSEELDKMFGPELHPTSPENRLRSINRSAPIGSPALPDYF